MTAKPEVLFLSHRIPYPPNKGDKIRSWRLLRYLAERFSVHLACFVDDAGDFRYAEKISKFCASAAFVPLRSDIATVKSAAGLISGEPLSVAYYRSRAMISTVARLRARPLAAEVVFSSTMAQYVELAIPGRPRIIDFCDADSEKWRQYSEKASMPLRWVYAREGARLAEAEAAIASWADACFAITAAEASIFNARPEMRRKVRWWTNGVDTNYFSPTTPLLALAEGADVVFTGAMDYRANVEAAHFFLDAVWPVIRTTNPDARIALVGSRPVKSLRARAGGGGVIVTGAVRDVRPWLRAAKLAIAPLRVARGLQNKVLEAMSMAKPVVATRAAATGVAAKPGEAILIADDADEMAQAVLFLLSSENARARIGLAARDAMLEGHQWNDQLRRFDQALFESMDGRRSPFSPSASMASPA